MQIYLYKSSTITRSLGKVWLEILVAKLATNFQDFVAKVKNLVALAPVLGAILRPAISPSSLFCSSPIYKAGFHFEKESSWRLISPLVLKK